MRSRILAALALLALTTAGFALEQPPTEETELQVVFETRIITVPADATVGECPKKEGAVAFLTDAQLKAALDAAQGNRRVNVMCAPKITALNGKDTVVKITDEQFFVTGLDAVKLKGDIVLIPRTTTVDLGMMLNVSGRVSSDKKAVAVDVKYMEKRVEGLVDLVPVITQITPVTKDGKKGKPMPFMQYLQAPQFETLVVAKSDLKIPSGGSVVIAGPTFVQDTREVQTVPVLSELPLLEDVFTKVSYRKDTMRKVLIVSAKVIETPKD